MKIHLFPSSDGIELFCSCGLEIDQQTKIVKARYYTLAKSFEGQKKGTLQMNSISGWQPEKLGTMQQDFPLYNES